MVKFIDDHLNNIKDKVSKMWSLVYDQIEKSHNTVLKMDPDIARQILTGEKRVNAFELEIDSDIEDFIALYTPVAIDLRFALAMLNINNNLERIGDYAEGIARFVLRCEDSKVDRKLLDDLRIDEMFRLVLEMLALTHNALIEEDSNRAKGVFAKDNRLDELNSDSLKILSDYASTHPESARVCIELSGVFRKLERAGDHINNLAEETIFYIDAHILKHHKKPTL